MHLAQHHFQAQSRYFEDLTAFTLNSVFFRAYGLVAVELDADALINGTVSVIHARGMMPDATPFHFPDDEPPAPLDIRARFSPTHDAHRVLLALPEWRPEKANCVLDGNGNSLRFRAEPQEMPDETTGRDARDVSIARKNFHLILDGGDVDEGLVTLPIARVRRDGAGHFVYDPAFVPPSLQIGASTRLVQLLARLVEILDAKAEAMTAERAAAGGNLAEYASREVANFWLSHAIHSAVAPLRHHLSTRTAHPEVLHGELARLAGALCTFSMDAHPRDLPLYEHDAPEAAFDALDRFIRRHLDVAIPTGYVNIPLLPAVPRTVSDKDVWLAPAPAGAGDPNFRLGSVPDKRCLGNRTHWFLGVRSSASTGDVIANVPTRVKMCAGRYVARLVKTAFPGLGLEHVPSPPAEIAPRLATTYFRVGRTEPCWGAIVSTSEVGIYIPASIPDAELDLVVVLEE
jgi:type VI secretion system protein ImpJ